MTVRAVTYKATAPTAVPVGQFAPMVKSVMRGLARFRVGSGLRTVTAPAVTFKAIVPTAVPVGRSAPLVKSVARGLARFRVGPGLRTVTASAATFKATVPIAVPVGRFAPMVKSALSVRVASLAERAYQTATILAEIYRGTVPIVVPVQIRVWREKYAPPGSAFCPARTDLMIVGGPVATSKPMKLIVVRVGEPARPVKGVTRGGALCPAWWAWKRATIHALTSLRVLSIAGLAV